MIHSQRNSNRGRHLSSRLRRLFSVVGRIMVAAGLSSGALVVVAGPSSAASLNAYSINQCANGGKGTLAVCTGSAYQSGDDNGSNSHWAEGDFLPFQLTLTGITAGSHTVALQYQTVDKAKHSYDYLGSFDATETTSSTPSPTHDNKNNPCAGIVTICNNGAGAPAATSTINIPTPSFTGVNATCGSAGTPPTLASSTGVFSLWGPTSSALTNVAYESPQDQTANSGCVTVIDVTFSAPADNSTLVLAWSAHIASELVWGAGNGAGAISGAPYHMWVNNLDGSGGAQERSLQSSAIIAQPVLTTVIQNAANAAVTTVPVGTPVHDTATLAGASSTASGTVTYELFSNGTCSGSPLITYSPVTVTNGAVPNSPSFTPTSIGTYSYEAVYSGDVIDASVTGACEGPLSVTPLTPGFTTQPASSSITFGGGITDTASVIGRSAGGIPGGTVQFSLCQVPSGSSSCTGGTADGSPVALVAPTSGFTSTATSPSVSPAPGNWCFNASYAAASGGNYVSVSAETNGANECFNVAKQGSQTATKVVASTVTFGAGGISDSVSVSPVSNTGPAPTGTVQFYVCETTSTFCTPSPASLDGSPVGLTVSPAIGSTSTATSPVFTPTSAGTWCFSAVYSGDNNYLTSQDNTTATNTDTNECVSVGKAPTATTTTVMDQANNGVWGGETTGASAYDTATVAPNPNFANAPTATGTISYTFFSNGSCSTTAGPGTPAGTGLPLGTRSSAEGPLNAGHYSFQATYSGDSNYAGSTGACEPFTVAQGTSSTGTIVFDAATGKAWTNTETTGASAFDTSSVTPSSTLIPATGSVSYTLFSNGSCTNTGTAAGGGSLVSGSAPNSDPTGPLGAGSYSFRATYSGDTNYAGSTGPCEQFSVGKGTSQTGTTVFDVATGNAWTNTETTGASAFDTSTVTGSFGGIAPTGTISYSFFTTGGCSQQSTSAGGGSLGANSNPEGPLGAGSYSFQAAYSGDGNYASSTGACEPLTVNQGSSQTATTVVDAATNQAWTGTEVGTPSAYDTTTVTPSSGNITATGTVSYTFFPNGSCTPDTGSSAEGGSLQNGLAPNSNTEGPLSQGTYSFRAVYSGDTNYAGSTGSCEQFVLQFAVITAAKSSDPVTGSVVHPGDTVTYTIALTNAGLAADNSVTVEDAVPAGTTYVPSSASDGGTLTGGIITWSGLTVPAQGTKSVTFKVTVNATDTDGQVIPNHAIYSNINTGDGCITSSDTTEGTCDTNTVTLTVSIPVINVVKSEPTPGNGQTVTAGQSAPITYKLAVTNAGSAVATNVVVTDVIPTGATYVAGSATPSVEATYNSSTKTITWTVPSVAAKSGSTLGEVDLTFQVTVDATDANGSTLTNQAAFTNVHTPNCTAGSTTAVCLTNTVSNPVVTPPPLQTQPAPQVAPTTTVPKHALAFTGLDTRMLAFLAVSLVTIGMMLVLIGRRRRPNN